MKIVMYGHTAYEWWMRSKDRGRASGVARSNVLSDCCPNAAGVEYLRRVAPFLSTPCHIFVPNQKLRRRLFHAAVHSSAYCYPDESFCRVGNGLYASSPELCFVQECADSECLKDFLRTLKGGYALCGSFAVNPLLPMGVEHRIQLSSRFAIERYLEKVPQLRGVPKARAISRHILDGSASPRESDLAMRLTLPCKMGGFGLHGACLNYRIELGLQGKRLARKKYHVADVCWPFANLVVEYDSDAAHLNSEQMTLDAIKRNALESDGFKVITVTSRQLDDPIEMGKIAHQIARRVGMRIRPHVAGYEDLQSQLYSLD